MPDPFVRDLGSVEGIDGTGLIVGVDYDAVSVGPCRFNFGQQEEFGKLFIAACHEAEANWERMRADA